MHDQAPTTTDATLAQGVTTPRPHPSVGSHENVLPATGHRVGQHAHGQPRPLQGTLRRSDTNRLSPLMYIPTRRHCDHGRVCGCNADHSGDQGVAVVRVYTFQRRQVASADRCCTFRLQQYTIRLPWVVGCSSHQCGIGAAGNCRAWGRTGPEAVGAHSQGALHTSLPQVVSVGAGHGLTGCRTPWQ
jgi:hypothetical protein